MNVTVEQIREAMSRTREARERVWQHRTTDAVITALAQAAKNWLNPKSPWRPRAAEQATAPTGFSEAMVNEAIDLTFGAITYESLGELLDRELGNRRVLDRRSASLQEKPCLSVLRHNNNDPEKYDRPGAIRGISARNI